LNEIRRTTLFDEGGGKDSTSRKENRLVVEHPRMSGGTPLGRDGPQDLFGKGGQLLGIGFIGDKLGNSSRERASKKKTEREGGRQRKKKTTMGVCQNRGARERWKSNTRTERPAPLI